MARMAFETLLDALSEGMIKKIKPARTPAKNVVKKKHQQKKEDPLYLTKKCKKISNQLFRKKNSL